MASLHLLQATSLSSCQRCYQHSFANAQKRHAAQYRSVLKCKAAQVSSIEAPVNSRGPASLHRPDLRGAVKSIYTDNYLEDAFSSMYTVDSPLFRCTSREDFKRGRARLLAIADIKYTLHSLSDKKDDVIRARWTFEAKLKVPGARKVVITGSSLYTVSPAGVLLSQTDTWDAVPGGAQLESATFLLKNALSPQSMPDLDTPQYMVLKKLQDYEVRRYPSFLVAEVDMPASSSPASGTGFNELAEFIFGGNDRKQSMEMTTPVLTTAGQQGASSNKMAFVMESKYASLDSLPVPRDSRVVRKEQEACVMAAMSFSGLPLDFQVTEAERKLRGLLLLDGLKAEGGYMLARYNAPFEPPFLRRNEVLIRLEGFEQDAAM